MARILQVCNTDFYANKFLSPVLQELVSRGHEVHCVCEGSAVIQSIHEAGVVVHNFKFPRRKSVLSFISAIMRMKRLIRAGRYDCVVSHNRNASIVARVAAWLGHAPLNIYVAHGFYFHDDQGVVARKLSLWLEALLAKITDYTLSQSLEDVMYVTSKGLVARERIRHIGNGIEIQRFSRRMSRAQYEQKLKLEAGRFRIATTGRLVSGKGFVDLLDAFADICVQIPESELIFIGGNIPGDIQPCYDLLAERIRKYGLEGRVRITGIVDNVEEYLHTADLFILPSYREGMPRSLIEAMAAGIPCCATDIRGCREIIEDRVTGWLFPASDSEALSKLILFCYQNAEIREGVAACAQSMVAREFAQSDYLERQIVAIEELLCAPTPGR